MIIVLHLAVGTLILNLPALDDRNLVSVSRNSEFPGLSEERWPDGFSGRRALLSGPGNRA
jgi:hypothetical protein